MILSPFSRPGAFLRGSLHCHSSFSGGSMSPHDLIERYRANGYDFVCITDTLSSGSTDALTDATSFGDDRLTIIPGAEFSIAEPRLNLTAVGLPREFAAPTAEETGADVARRAAQAGAFVTLARPALYRLTTDGAQTIESAHAVEVFNAGSELAHSCGDGSYLVDSLCDHDRHILLTAVDGSRMRTPDLGKAWVYVRSLDRSPASLVAALKGGAYYCSTGGILHSLWIEGTTRHVECSGASEILVNGRNRASTFVCGESITRADIDLKALKGSPWFRVIIFGVNQCRAWTNPYWFDDLR